MSKALKLVIAITTAHLWVFFACAFVATSFDITQWATDLRFMCVALSVPFSVAVSGFVFTEVV